MNILLPGQGFHNKSFNPRSLAFGFGSLDFVDRELIANVPVVSKTGNSNFLTDWNYRKSFTLSRASGAVTNYQMKLLIGESSGATGENVDCGGHCLSSFNDIRFTNSSGTLLDYWIESISGTTPNQLATIWIEFDSIGTTATTFYMYYGNSEAEAYSNGEDTFPFFDHFDGDLSKWTTNYGTPVVASSVVTFNGTQYERITTTATYGTNYAFRAQVGMDSANVGGITFDEHHGLGNYLDGTDQFCFRTYSTNWGSQTKTTISNRISGTNILELRRNASTSVIAVLNDNVGATHTTNFVTVDGGGRIGLGATGGTFTSDWALVRQWLVTEPAWGSWGSEENNLSIATLTRNILTNIPIASLSSEITNLLTRGLSANISVESLTNEIISLITRNILANISVDSLTNEIISLITRNILTNISASSSVSDIIHTILRNLSVNILSFSSTSDIVVILGMAIELAANILGISVTNDIVVSLTRSLSVLIDILTSTNVVDVTINRELYTNIVIDSSTEDVIVSVTRTRMLLADIQGTSITSNDLILLLVALGMIIDPDSLTVLGERSIGRKGGKSIASRSGKKTIVSK